MLESLGLGADADTTYQLILANPEFGVAELASWLGWPSNRVRAALDELARLSLVRPSGEPPGSVRPVSPELGLTSLLARQERELVQRQQEVAASRLAVTQLISEHADLYRPRPGVEQLAGTSAIWSRIENLAASCRTEIMAFAPCDSPMSAAPDVSRPLDQAVLDRGVLMRTVCVYGIYNQPEAIGYARWLAERGAMVRTAPQLSLWLIIYDRARTIVPADPDSGSPRAILMHEAGLTGALCELFERVWDGAIPLSPERPRRSRKGLTAQEGAVVRLLAEGFTDEVIARRIGVSVRTARRITAELMTRLAARSRFQAGVRAAELGLIDPRPPGNREA